MIILYNLLLCDNPFNVLLQELKKNKHWCSAKSTVAFVTQTQIEKKCQNMFYK